MRVRELLEAISKANLPPQVMEADVVLFNTNGPDDTADDADANDRLTDVSFVEINTDDHGDATVVLHYEGDSE